MLSSGFVILGTWLSVILGTWLSYFYQGKITKKDEDKKTKLFLISIKSEISSVWSHYEETAGRLIENLKDNEGFDFYYPIFDNYFVVYDNNTNLIGNLDKDLNEILVKTYILAKSLKDSFICNNHLLNEMKRYHDLAQETGIKHYSIQHQTCRGIWQDYGKGIQEIHFKLKKSKDILIENINAKLD